MWRVIYNFRKFTLGCVISNFSLVDIKIQFIVYFDQIAIIFFVYIMYDKCHMFFCVNSFKLKIFDKFTSVKKTKHLQLIEMLELP